MTTVQHRQLWYYFLFIGTTQPGKPRLMPAAVLWLSDDTPKPTCWGCSHLLTDGGSREDRGDAGGGWVLLGLSYFLLAVLLQVLHDAPNPTSWGGPLPPPDGWWRGAEG